MTVPTPNPAALNPSPGTEPAAVTSEAFDPADARTSHQSSTTLVTPASRAGTASLAAFATTQRVSAVAAAVSTPGSGPDAGPSGEDQLLASHDNDPSRQCRPPRLRIGWHTTSGAGLRPPDFASGLILGRDDFGRAVAVPLFTAEPARVALVGSHRLAQIILLRALALCAAAVITTVDPPAWQGFGRGATGEADRVFVLPEGRPVTAVGTAGQPALIVEDLGLEGPAGPAGSAAAPPQGAWQTRLTVLRTLIPASKAARALADQCRFLLVESPDRDDTLVLLQDGESRRVHLTPTSVERRAFGTSLTAPPLTA